MKKLFALISILSALLFLNCEDFGKYSVILDNQSSYDVTVELYTGSTHEDGSMVFEEYTVSANDKITIKSEVQTVYVNTYSAAGGVDMEIDGSRITFTNQ